MLINKFFLKLVEMEFIYMILEILKMVINL